MTRFTSLGAGIVVGASALLGLAGQPGRAMPMPGPNVQDFVGHYDAVNWTFDGGLGNGSVDLSQMPMTLTITGSSNGQIGPTDYAMLMPMQAGQVNFDFDYRSDDSATYDGFGYLLNGAFTLLVDDDAIGAVMFDLSFGDTFGFRVVSLDGTMAPGIVTISNFSAPGDPLPEEAAPGPVPLLGAAAAFGWSRRLRRRARQPLPLTWE